MAANYPLVLVRSYGQHLVLNVVGVSLPSLGQRGCNIPSTALVIVLLRLPIS